MTRSARPTPPCPRCGQAVVRRCPRSGLVDRLLSAVYLYPFRCQLCTHRFRALHRGVRYSRLKPERREFDPAAVRLPVDISYRRVRARGALTTVSQSGASVTTDLSVQDGATLGLQILLPAGRPINVEGALVRSVRANSLGLEFVRMRAEERDRLREFVLRALGYGQLSASGPAADGRGRLRRRWAAAWPTVLVVLAIGLCVMILFPSVSICLWGKTC